MLPVQSIFEYIQMHQGFYKFSFLGDISPRTFWSPLNCTSYFLSLLHFFGPKNLFYRHPLTFLFRSLPFPGSHFILYLIYLFCVATAYLPVSFLKRVHSWYIFCNIACLLISLFYLIADWQFV